eukprot:maker-scaffold518_size150039-snap-gene-0.18 protein:Tk09558 transcript:maker-scaffold518_size150039-snap-gene-0.18-mRNA-1 annotation:"scp-like extracellular domain containing protein 1"
MKAFITVIALLSAPVTEVLGGCSQCLSKDTVPARFQYLFAGSAGPCFKYDFGSGPKDVCFKNTAGNVLFCSESDPLCQLGGGPPATTVAPTTAAPGALGVHGGNVNACSAVSVQEDCSADSTYYGSRFGQDHTMVKYCGAGSACNVTCSYGIPGMADIQRILDKHNDLRAKVANGQESRAFNSANGQPGAKNMYKLKWDPELAKVAQRWAQTCAGSHDSLRSTVQFSPAGQNMAWRASTATPNGRNYEASIQAWYDEVDFMHPSIVDSFVSQSNTLIKKKANGQNEAIGHYTQVVWGETKYVGCGVIVYATYNTQHNRVFYNERFMCNYGSAGNYLNQPIYETASSTSEIGASCPNGQANGLCTH